MRKEQADQNAGSASEASEIATEDMGGREVYQGDQRKEMRSGVCMWEAPETKAICEKFLKELGYRDITPDAIGQLSEAFLPALDIMLKRGYNPNGESWKESGWMGQLFEIRKRASRLVHNTWIGGRFDESNTIDMINYAGFLYRLKGRGKPWGKWEEPGKD